MPKHRFRFLLLAVAMASLIAAVWGGLQRLGWALPTWQPRLLIQHGPLMVSGFLGTLIGIERVVALEALSPGGRGYGWTYLGPVLSASGAILLAGGVPGLTGPLLMSLGSLGLVAMFIVIVRMQPALFTYTMALGALLWLGGNLLILLGKPVSEATYWWAGFLLATIAGERLELGRILAPSRARHLTFLASLGLFLAGLLLVPFRFDLGVRIFGVGILALALWLLANDTARRTIRSSGLTRFSAASLLSGYLWLVVSGLLAATLGGVRGGPLYDALLHSFFLGFVFAMIFGHAPIIFPAVLGRPVGYHSSLYVHLAVLHLSMLVRMAGALGGWHSLRMWGGMLNALAVLIFMVNTARLTLRPPSTPDS